MTPEISFKVVIFGSILRVSLGVHLENYSKHFLSLNILVKQIFPFPLLQYFQKHFFTGVSISQNPYIVMVKSFPTKI